MVSYGDSSAKQALALYGDAGHAIRERWLQLNQAQLEQIKHSGDQIGASPSRCPRDLSRIPREEEAFVNDRTRNLRPNRNVGETCRGQNLP